MNKKETVEETDEAKELRNENLDLKRKLGKIEKAASSHADEIALELVLVMNGGSVAELRRLVQGHMPKEEADRKAYLKQLERLKNAAEAAYISAQEVVV